MNAKSIIILLLVSTVLFQFAASLKRSIFPADFVFGSASSAYQYEGAANEGGKGPSIWDTYTHKYPERIKDHSNGDVATDSYHRYKEDVAIMKYIGFNAYRFSISWSRILPNGSIEGGVNREGIVYYNNLINELQAKGLQPFTTLFHWDTPQGIEDAYGGFLSPKIVKDFADYADLCFREFGDRVKNWITFNEPYIYATDGYGNGGSPPSRCSPGPGVGRNCTAGDSSAEPYLVAHHQILAHAAAVNVYREKYKASQKGQIGITLNSFWFVPLSQSNADKEAASRGLAFMLDWFLQPIYSGAYPAVIVEKVREHLPKFSAEQSLMVEGSFDFIGYNYYTATYAADIPCQTGKRNVFTDSCVRFTALRNGVPIGPKAASDWLYIYPQGIQDLLQYTKEKYNNPVMYITENGLDELNDGKRSLNDLMRIGYIYHHLVHVRKAIRNGVRVKGYFTWSLLDNFEWNFGYTVRFGMVYVDYQNGQRRYLKRSALWFKLFLHH